MCKHTSQLVLLIKKMFVPKCQTVGSLWSVQYMQKGQLWFLTTFNWNKVKVWNFHHRYSTYGCIFHKNFNVLPCFVWAGEPSQKPIFDKKQVFGDQFSPKIWVSLRAGLYRVRVPSVEYDPIEKSAWNLQKWLMPKVIFDTAL